ncbi:adenylate/guanylate cyclase domain-containing protein [Polaromonas sp. JS666]|uniref:adenylate/guanylate cyclase domain-containing protein n=1 Tax=Polaromonas sp. (strain JS666 / ATCC BAA-500) TaxID=296591 RepID=UPI00004648CF|nr:adenylate/guanylate cyclase domain-containing protein [Polaromonas sp. JS666]ABE46352.1 adenylate/guanylate cyclase [Polaromonas sp. JS666]
MDDVARPGAGEPLHSSAGAMRAPVQRRSRVLIVEDTADIRYFLETLLKDQYEVAAASAGETGLQMATGEPRPEIILLDVMMPDMDGYEVMRQLAKDPRTAEIPVIFLTALGSVADEQKGLDLGATDYITKPISPPILLARVRLHLERSANARRLKDLSEQLSRYLAPQVYQSLFDGSRQAEIQTQRKRLTVFFSDIKNFTASTAQWQPEEVTLLLNSYFAEMSQIAAEYGATLDKFIGDAIVIFFGDPHSLGPRRDALQCVRMAVAMQRRMQDLQRRWRSMDISKTFEIRIGINSGFCDVGNFGSALRMEYTIIGREVNLAARLEQAAEPGEILISSETYALVRGEILADAREPLLAKGFAEPIAIYAVDKAAMEGDGDASIIRCDRPGLRMDIDLGRLTGAERTQAAVQIRKALVSLEALPDAAAVPEPAAADAADVSLPEHMAGLDLALGLSRAMGLNPLYVSMLRRFQQSHQETIARIRQALEDGELKTAELLSHSLRGVAGQIGATRVPHDAEALEQALGGSQPREAIDGRLAALEVSLGELIAALHAGLPPEAAAP